MEITLDVYEAHDLKNLIKGNIAELENLVMYMDSDVAINRLKDKIARLKTVLWKIGGTR